VALILCEYCESSNHDACNCPYRTYIDATCASVEKTLSEMIDIIVETMKEIIAEYSQCFIHSKENYNVFDCSLGSPKSEVSLYDDFEHFILLRLIYKMICL